jgi:hypothetical protein
VGFEPIPKTSPKSPFVKSHSLMKLVCCICFKYFGLGNHISLLRDGIEILLKA